MTYVAEILKSSGNEQADGHPPSDLPSFRASLADSKK